MLENTRGHTATQGQSAAAVFHRGSEEQCVTLSQDGGAAGADGGGGGGAADLGTDLCASDAVWTDCCSGIPFVEGFHTR